LGFEVRDAIFACAFVPDPLFHIAEIGVGMKDEEAPHRAIPLIQLRLGSKPPRLRILLPNGAKVCHSAASASGSLTFPRRAFGLGAVSAKSATGLRSSSGLR
jgi:hypothetical protein